MINGLFINRGRANHDLRLEFLLQAFLRTLEKFTYVRITVFSYAQRFIKFNIRIRHKINRTARFDMEKKW